MNLITRTSRAVRDGLRSVRRNCLDSVGLVPTWLAVHWLGGVRRTHQIQRLPRTRALFERRGVYPLIDHYYEPLINRQALTPDRERVVPGIEWRPKDQWALVEGFAWRAELELLPFRASKASHGYYLDNGYFGPGDADVYYSLLRQFKPRRVVEIGAGHSTRLAALALALNAEEGDHGQLTCVEPYRHPDWLLALDAELIQTPVEALDASWFAALEPGDILFIDSSHMVRPEGDVLFEVMEILPRLAPGVLVHVHDIFSPGDYPREWLVDRMHFWNEQYLLEAFLAHNPNFEILCSLQYLLSRDAKRLEAALPRLSERGADHATTSLWFRRTNAS